MAKSQNGFEVVPEYGKPTLTGNVTVPGTKVQLLGGVLTGDVATVLLYVAQRFHNEVEPLEDGQCWGYAKRVIAGTDAWSNHASGTAIDLNSVLHKQGFRNTFNPMQRDAIRRIVKDCQGVVRWGGYFDFVDEMHWEIVGDPSALAARIRGDQPDKAPTFRGDDDTMYILNQPVKAKPDIRIAILSGPMFVGLGSEGELKAANEQIAAGAPHQWVENNTWNDFDARSKYATGKAGK